MESALLARKLIKYNEQRRLIEAKVLAEARQMASGALRKHPKT